MKYIFAALITLSFSGCIKKAMVTFNGLVPGVKSGVFIVKDAKDSTVFGENIKDGKFTIPQKLLKEPGYYLMKISDDDNKDNRDAVEIYLDNGGYKIETLPGKLYLYPQITSSSPVQNQLSAFYALSDKLNASNNQQIKQLKAQLKAKGENISKTDYSYLINNISAAEIRLVTNNANAFREFVKQYPQSDITCHLMSGLDYQSDPAPFYAIYKTLSPAARNSDEGKEIGEKLSHLVNLVAGAKAPVIYGKTPDGKIFDPKTISKKLVLIDFWRAGDDISRLNHQKLISLLKEDGYSKNLEVVSVSFDKRRDWWTTGIHADGMDWVQISDLKGDDSPNAVNWSITKIPTYYLLDSKWNILERDIDIRNVDISVTEHIKSGR